MTGTHDFGMSRIRRRGTAFALAAAVPCVLLACSPSPGGDGEPRLGADVGSDAVPERDFTGEEDPAPSADGQASGSEAVGRPATTARANLSPTEGSSVSGVVEFRSLPRDALSIHLEVAGLEPGPHGIHIHEVGDCSAPDASSAGDHYAPDGQSHGSPAADEHHAGDLGNFEANESGVAIAAIVTEALTLGEAHAQGGRHPIEGRAVIVHRGADDFVTQPDGNAGDRMACGVIEEAV